MQQFYLFFGTLVPIPNIVFPFIKKHAIIQHIVGFYLVTLLLNVRRSFNGTRKVQQS